MGYIEAKEIGLHKSHGLDNDGSLEGILGRQIDKIKENGLKIFTFIPDDMDKKVFKGTDYRKASSIVG